MTTVGRRAVAEAVGTGLLVATVVGSGIAAARLSPGQAGLQLLENSLATGLVLAVLIVTLQPVSAAFNPVVTVIERFGGTITTAEALALIGAQVAGGAGGAVLANLMFRLPPVSLSGQARDGAGVWLGEVVATGGLVLVIVSSLRSGAARQLGPLVGAYIAGAYWFTSSTGFANPAVTIARTLTDTFSGIRPASVPIFVIAEIAGAALGLALAIAIHPRDRGQVPLDGSRSEA